jgi:dolichol-phosphate mannosyltransferase
MKNIILMPTYNEKKNVEIVIPQIFALLPEIYILVIDDNSPDGTAEEVKFLMSRYPNLSILERSQKTGLGDAYKDAIKKVLTDKEVGLVITMDADGSHDPEYLPIMLKEIVGHDLIIGSRYINSGGIENWELWRRLLSKFGNLYSRILTGMKIGDSTSGFMCIKRKLLERVNFEDIDCTGYAFLLEFKFYCINKLGAKFKEIPIIFKERGRGESKMSHKIIIEGVIAPVKIFVKRFF